MTMRSPSWFSALAGSARFGPWLVAQADPEMGHFLELAPFSPSANEASCYPDSFRDRARIEGSIAGRTDDPDYQSGHVAAEKRRDEVGPSKHSAKQEAFVTVLAWSVIC